jgi:hypothetical protein
MSKQPIDPSEEIGALANPGGVFRDARRALMRAMADKPEEVRRHAEVVGFGIQGLRFDPSNKTWRKYLMQDLRRLEELLR